MQHLICSLKSISLCSELRIILVPLAMHEGTFTVVLKIQLRLLVTGNSDLLMDIQWPRK